MEDVLADKEVRRPPAMGGGPGEGCLPLPMLPPRASRSACAPKETRREKGEGGVSFGGLFSLSSSIAASSRFAELEPTELDMLAGRRNRLLTNGEDRVGDPERPSVFRDSLRCFLDWAFAAAVAMELGSDGGAAAWLADLEKRSVKESPWDKETRRECVDEGIEMGLEWSLDMIKGYR